MQQQQQHFFDNPKIPYLATEISQKSLNHILDKGAWQLYEKYLWNKCPAYYAQDIISYNDGVIGQQAIPFDKGESKVQLSHKWVQEKEPLRIDLDHNARISVKIEYKATQQTDQGGEDTFSQRSSILSNKSSVLGKGRFSQFKTIKNISTLSVKSKEGDAEPTKNTVSELKFETVELDYDMFRPPTPDSDIDRMRETREKKEKVNNIKKAADNKKKEEDNTFEEKKNVLIKNLKNRKYTYEYDGQIIYIKNQTRFGEKDIKDTPIEQEGLQYKNPNKTSGEVTRVSLNVKPQTVKMMEEFKKKKKDEQVFKTEEFNKQPNQVETLKPKPGVQIQFPNGVKKEGDKIESETRMKKEDYQKMIENMPNRPVPTYNLHQKQNTNLDLPKMSDFESDLRKKIGSMTGARPLTASNLQQINEYGYFRASVSKINIVEKEHFIKMMQEELPINKLTQASKAGSFISMKKSDIESETKLDLITQLHLDKDQQKKQGQSKDFDRIKTFKKKEYGPKGSIEVSYDIGVKMAKQLKKDIIDNDSKIHKKVDKFNKQILENDQWGQDIPSLHPKENKHPEYNKLHSNVKRVQSAKNLHTQPSRVQSASIYPTKETKSTKPTEQNIRISTAKSMKSQKKSQLITNA